MELIDDLNSTLTLAFTDGSQLACRGALTNLTLLTELASNLVQLRKPTYLAPDQTEDQKAELEANEELWRRVEHILEIPVMKCIIYIFQSWRG